MVTTVTSEETLASALDDVRRERARLGRRRRKWKRAQDRAAATYGLVAAAQRHFGNAEARYRVLLAAAEPAGDRKRALNAEAEELQAALAATKEELARAEAIQQAAEQCLAALGSISEAVEAWSAPAAKPASSVTTRNRAEQVRRPLSELRAAVEGLATAAVDHPMLESLRTKQTELEEEHADVRQALGTKRSETARADMQKARAEFETAARALREAPESERRAQADVRLANAALAEAERRYRTAVQARDEAELIFIEGIDLTGPDTGGVITARARLRRDVPVGYRLSWSAEGGLLREFVGVSVPVDTRQAPPGSYALEVHLDRAEGQKGE